jgi:curved DNA-binding protein CbpA
MGELSEIDGLRDVELMVTGEEDFAEEKLAAVNAAWREQADLPYRELTGIEQAGEPGVDGQEVGR